MSDTREKIARDLGAGLLRKGWILPHDLAKIVPDLMVLIDQNDYINDTIRDAAELKAQRYNEVVKRPPRGRKPRIN